MTQESAHRQALQNARRIVIKIGSRILVQRNGRPDLQRMRALVADIAALHRAGREVVVVSSGAIAAGMEALGLRSRPEQLPDLQMCAAVGQSRLMASYDRLFTPRRIRIGQVLLTHDALQDRARHLNARNTMMTLLRNRIVPIVNENDTIAVEEIKFGDNDLLASLVSLLIGADLLILLTSVDGLREPAKAGRTRRVRFLQEVTPAILALAKGKGSALSTGGMASKLKSAGMVVASGIPVVIANGRADGIMSAVMAGADTGTLIQPPDGRRGQLSSREQWIAFFNKPEGALIVDDGAAAALLNKGRSLLPIGIQEVEGDFNSGAVVRIRRRDGAELGCGVVSFASEEIRRIRGRRTAEAAAILGARDYAEVIHRDNMVLPSAMNRPEKE